MESMADAKEDWSRVDWYVADGDCSKLGRGTYVERYVYSEWFSRKYVRTYYYIPSLVSGRMFNVQWHIMNEVSCLRRNGSPMQASETELDNAAARTTACHLLPPATYVASETLRMA
jgi:hypothetical protein